MRRLAGVQPPRTELARDLMERFAHRTAPASRAACPEPGQRANETWREHEDIDDVMLATALLPDGFLDLEPPHAAAA
jgi:hypothetical protein